MDHKKKKKTKLFWKVYAIVAASVALLLVGGLFVFYDFINAYETAQPQTAANEYLLTLDESKVTDMAKTAVDSLGITYEDPASYVQKYTDAWKANTAVCRKNLTESTPDNPIYSIFCGNLEVCRFSLKDSGDGSYGFESWEVTDPHTPTDSITKNGAQYSVCVPDGGILTINGYTAESPVADAEPYPMLSSLETSEMALCDKYDTGLLYSAPEIKCTFDGEDCAAFNDGGVIYFTKPGSSLENYTVTAPTGASVYVNDVLLDDKFIGQSAVPYSYSEYESSADSLPTQTVYATGGLFAKPTVKVVLSDAEIPVSVNENTYTAAYPKSLMYSLSVKVPEGSDIKINGKDIAEPTSTESAFAGLLADEVESPMYDVYTVTDLFAPIESVSGTLDGTELNFFTAVNKDDNGSNQLYISDYSTLIDESVVDFAKTYTRTYFRYTSQGYVNTDANLAAVLALVQPNTEIYKNIQGSKIGYEFASPVSSSTENQLEASGMFLLDDGSFVINLAFDVDQSYGSVNRTYAGELSLHIVNSGYGFKVAAMVISNK